MLRDISVTGAKTARVYYDCDGWVAHHNIDLWRGTAPVDAARFGMWPVGGAWLCQHLWEHYVFTGDRQFLKESYPIMRGSAQFLLELLVEDPKHHWLVTPFSMSPEHGYYDCEGKLAFLSPAPTMDVAMIRELFPHCIEASKLLGVDEEFRARLEAALTRIPPTGSTAAASSRSGSRTGSRVIRDTMSRPTSPSIPAARSPCAATRSWRRAIGNWMETRRPRGGWPTAWDLAMWARLERGDKVAACMRAIVRNSLAPTCTTRARISRTATSATRRAWPRHCSRVMRARSACCPRCRPTGPTARSRACGRAAALKSSMQWKAGKLVSAQIRGITPGPCRVRSGGKTVTVPLQAGQTLKLNADLVSGDDVRGQR